MAARIRKGDNVVVISGSDKGKTGKVLAVFADSDKVVVEGVNVKKRHMRRTQQSEGQIITKEAPLFASKVMPVDPKTGKGTRVSIKIDDKGQKSRLAKSGEVIPTVFERTGNEG